MLKIKEIQAKTLLTSSKLKDADYVINPYVGCMHNCIYCYARFMKRFYKIDQPWGGFVGVKSGYRLHFKNYQYPHKTILVGSVTDPYQYVEKKYRLMPDILVKLLEFPGQVEILTKSDLVLRDLALLKKIKNLKVGISLNTLDQNFSKIIEPGAPSAKKRLSALKTLHEEGITTYLFIAPIFPEITPLEELFLATKDITSYYLCENLNLRGTYKKTTLDLIKKYYPQHIDIYTNIYEKKDSCYWQKCAKYIGQLSEELHLDTRLYFDH